MDTDGIFLNRIFIRITHEKKYGQISFVKKDNTIYLPINKLTDINTSLEKITIDELLDRGRSLISQKSENKSDALSEIMSHFKFSNEFDELNAIRLLLSAYVVFRSAKNIIEKFKENDLLIMICPLRGSVSNQEKEGSWLLLFQIPINIENKDVLKNEELQYLESLTTDFWWPLIRGADLNASIRVNHQCWSLSLEKLIPEMVSIDSEMIQKENKTATWIIENVGDSEISDKEKQISKQDCWPEKVIGNLKKIVGQNNDYIEFMRRLKGTAKLGKVKLKDGKPSAEVISIFLYSEPGTGKETLSYLIHLWSRAHLNNINLENSDYIKGKHKLWGEFYELYKGYYKEIAAQAGMATQDLKNPYITNSSDESKKLIENELIDSFFSINCAQLDRDNFSKLLFGTIQKPNGLLKTAFHSGTCFFDEFNTIQKGLENHLLKLLVDPNEALVYKTNHKNSEQVLLKNFNCIFVFASNKTPDELIKEGYNPAVISRVSQYYFEVPPLRNRKEDMLLSLISQLEKLKENANWGKIDPTALRFLCMLPWEGNYRSLQGFVNDLFNDRMLRGIKNMEITFQEVVECAVRRKLIG